MKFACEVAVPVQQMMEELQVVGFEKDIRPKIENEYHSVIKPIFIEMMDDVGISKDRFNIRSISFVEYDAANFNHAGAIYLVKYTIISRKKKGK